MDIWIDATYKVTLNKMVFCHCGKEIKMFVALLALYINWFTHSSSCTHSLSHSFIQQILFELHAWWFQQRACQQSESYLQSNWTKVDLVLLNHFLSPNVLMSMPHESIYQFDEVKIVTFAGAAKGICWTSCRKWVVTGIHCFEYMPMGLSMTAFWVPDRQMWKINEQVIKCPTEWANWHCRQTISDEGVMVA